MFLRQHHSEDNHKKLPLQGEVVVVEKVGNEGVAGGEIVEDFCFQSVGIVVLSNDIRYSLILSLRKKTISLQVHGIHPNTAHPKKKH